MWGPHIPNSVYSCSQELLVLMGYNMYNSQYPLPSHPPPDSSRPSYTQRNREKVAILVKWRPLGRSNNSLVVGWIPLNICNSRDPVNLGELTGVLHLSPPRWEQRRGETNTRSSRRGKEQMRPKTFEFGRRVKTKRSDLMTGENPCKGTRETPLSYPLISTFKRTTPQKDAMISASAAVTKWRMDRVRV